ncbi:hypothetical protein IV500_17620 [Paeniglutamicibacter antarcticus]|uniref:Uncharacterized protein n=1 Tax=Arthrobacter terrae TaxID=2935737 RepID=A0A931CUI2_9MICC|nr:hypothetical protein [Arthrobacter terrae]MBG0741189.1 hypothetical protein [Arthrobacter terrae]
MGTNAESEPNTSDRTGSSEVPDKQLHRWKGEGGALPPEPDEDEPEALRVEYYTERIAKGGINTNRDFRYECTGRACTRDRLFPRGMSARQWGVRFLAVLESSW